VRNLFAPVAFSLAYVALLLVCDSTLAIRISSWGLGPLGLASSIISLLLVFRTNTSYQRFAESRALWGSLVNTGRDLVRRSITYFPDGQGARAMARWVVALAHCVRLHMRTPREEAQGVLARVLLPSEAAVVAAAAHRPNACLQALGQLIYAQVADKHTALRLDESLSRMEDVVGGCERLYRTPIPLSYTRHTSRMLLVWLAYMPLAMYGEIGGAALVVAPLLVIALFGIDVRPCCTGTDALV